jgi:hypothetical protein
MASAYGLQIRSIYTHKSGCLGMALAPVRLIGRLRETLDARLADSRYGDIQLDLGLRSAGESDRLVLNPKGRHGRKLDLQLPDSALLQLAMGHLSVASLLVAHPNACGEPATPEVLGLLDTVFPSGHPFMWHTDRY